MKKTKILILDNYDSFTYNLFDYFCQLGTDCEVIRNDALCLEDFAVLDFDRLVLSPGPKRPADAGLLLPLLDYFHSRVPILGICLGHQAIGEFFGASLCHTRVPMHGKTSLIQHSGHPLFENIPTQHSVMRYHSLTLQGLEGSPLQCIAHTDDGEVMAVAHRELPIFGVQYHPESILTEYGMALLENWVQLTTAQIANI
ncbi:MAG TPA: aminodeoxychorismate/anthranilate synthase component II [Phaeodactylibacter sp.]|nr:aminodeoxychorismate/anthranilate synthase component II [Phaeodactylibacter sp.]